MIAPSLEVAGSVWFTCDPGSFGAVKFLLLPARLATLTATNQEERKTLLSESSSLLKSVYVFTFLGVFIEWSKISPSQYQMAYKILGSAQTLMGAGVTISYWKSAPSEKKMDKVASALVVILTALETYFGNQSDYLPGRQALWVGTSGYSLYRSYYFWKYPDQDERVGS